MSKRLIQALLAPVFVALGAAGMYARDPDPDPLEPEAFEALDIPIRIVSKRGCQNQPDQQIWT